MQSSEVCQCPPDATRSPACFVDCRATLPNSWLIEESCCDIAHIRLLEFVVLSVHPVNSNILESTNDSGHIETHSHEPVNETCGGPCCIWRTLTHFTTLHVFLSFIVDVGMREFNQHLERNLMKWKAGGLGSWSDSLDPTVPYCNGR